MISAYGVFKETQAGIQFDYEMGIVMNAISVCILPPNLQSPVANYLICGYSASIRQSLLSSSRNS